MSVYPSLHRTKILPYIMMRRNKDTCAKKRRVDILSPVHTTRIYGPCLRPVNTGRVYRPLM